MLKFTSGKSWTVYWGPGPLPPGASALGVISRKGGKGALLLLSSGQYVQGNAGGIRPLPQGKVKALLVS